MPIKTALATAHPFEGLHLRVAKQYQQDRLAMDKVERRKGVACLLLASYFAAFGFDDEPHMTPQEAFAEAMAHVGVTVDPVTEAHLLRQADLSPARYGFLVDGEAVSAIDLYLLPRFGTVGERCMLIAQKIVARTDTLSEIPR